jgi:hypothetical protein
VNLVGFDYFKNKIWDFIFFNSKDDIVQNTIFLNAYIEFD